MFWRHIDWPSITLSYYNIEMTMRYGALRNPPLATLCGVLVCYLE
jgi:hypothetical protein